MTMAIKGLPVNNAIWVFKELAKEAFTPHQILLPGFPALSALLRLIVSYFVGGKYPTKGIEGAIKQVFEESLTIFNCTHATAIGAKVAILATAVAGCKPLLFTNYRGKGLRPSDCGEYTDPSFVHFRCALTVQDTTWSKIESPNSGRCKFQPLCGNSC
jgi:hypothetical protein